MNLSWNKLNTVRREIWEKTMWEEDDADSVADLDEADQHSVV